MYCSVGDAPKNVNWKFIEAELFNNIINSPLQLPAYRLRLCLCVLSSVLLFLCLASPDEYEIRELAAFVEAAAEFALGYQLFTFYRNSLKILQIQIKYITTPTIFTILKLI